MEAIGCRAPLLVGLPFQNPTQVCDRVNRANNDVTLLGPDELHTAGRVDTQLLTELLRDGGLPARRYGHHFFRPCLAHTIFDHYFYAVIENTIAGLDSWRVNSAIDLNI